MHATGSAPHFSFAPDFVISPSAMLSISPSVMLSNIRFSRRHSVYLGSTHDRPLVIAQHCNVSGHIPLYMLDEDGASGLLDGAPLWASEDIYSLQDPIRYSKLLANRISGDGFAGLAWEQKHQAIYAVMNGHLHRELSRVTRIGTCRQATTRTLEVSRQLTDLLCDANRIGHGFVCCDHAIRQRKPALPLGINGYYFNDIDHSAVISGTAEWAAMEFDLAWTDSGRRSVYHSACPHIEAHGRDKSLVRIVSKMAIFAQSVFLLVNEYIGRRLSCALVSPWLEYSCPLHPSALDRLDGQPVKLNGRASMGSLLRMNLYHYVLVPFTLSHTAKVKHLQYAFRWLRSRFSADAHTVESLSKLPETGTANHARSHRKSLAAWQRIYTLYTDPESIMAAIMGRDTFDLIAGEHSQASWPRVLETNLLRVISFAVGHSELYTRVDAGRPTGLTWVYPERYHWLCPHLTMCLGVCFDLQAHKPPRLYGPGCEIGCVYDGFCDTTRDWVVSFANRGLKRPLAYTATDYQHAGRADHQHGGRFCLWEDSEPDSSETEYTEE
jgi:hypothetical protein